MESTWTGQKELYVHAKRAIQKYFASLRFGRRDSTRFGSDSCRISDHIITVAPTSEEHTRWYPNDPDRVRKATNVPVDTRTAPIVFVMQQTYPMTHERLRSRSYSKVRTRLNPNGVVHVLSCSNASTAFFFLEASTIHQSIETTVDYMQSTPKLWRNERCARLGWERGSGAVRPTGDHRPHHSRSPFLSYPRAPWRPHVSRSPILSYLPASDNSSDLAISTTQRHRRTIGGHRTVGRGRQMIIRGTNEGSDTAICRTQLKLDILKR